MGIMDKVSIKRMLYSIDDLEIFEIAAKMRDADNKTENDLVIEECLNEEIEDIRQWIHENGFDQDEQAN